MSAVRHKDTSPEMLLRRLLHARGFRYRLHSRKLPGKPDIVFPSLRKAIFVHGCFWHGHHCAKGRLPKSRLDYWGPKIEANKERDTQAVEALLSQGWTSMIVWQCELREPCEVLELVLSFLNSIPPTK